MLQDDVGSFAALPFCRSRGILPSDYRTIARPAENVISGWLLLAGSEACELKLRGGRGCG